MARLPCGKWALAQLALPLVPEVSFPGKRLSWRQLIKVTPREQDILAWQKQTEVYNKSVSSCVILQHAS